MFRDVAADTEIDQGEGLPKLKFRRGERVFVSLAKANRDVRLNEWHRSRPRAERITQSTTFGPDNEHVIDPERPHSDYLLFGHGAQTLLGDEFVEKARWLCLLLFCAGSDTSGGRPCRRSFGPCSASRTFVALRDVPDSSTGSRVALGRRDDSNP